jgi:hypothetical protein
MFDLLFKDKATLRGAATRDARNAVSYEEKTDEAGFTLTLRCRFERRGRRVMTTPGVETQTDASMLYRSSNAPLLELEDLVVIAGETFRVVGITKQRLEGTAVEYSRADLALDRTVVPEDVDAS